MHAVRSVVDVNFMSCPRELHAVQVWGSDDQRDMVHVQQLVNRLPRASMAARVANKRQGHWVGAAVVQEY